MTFSVYFCLSLSVSAPLSLYLSIYLKTWYIIVSFVLSFLVIKQFILFFLFHRTKHHTNCVRLYLLHKFIQPSIDYKYKTTALSSSRRFLLQFHFLQLAACYSSRQKPGPISGGILRTCHCRPKSCPRIYRLVQCLRFSSLKPPEAMEVATPNSKQVAFVFNAKNSLKLVIAFLV